MKKNRIKLTESQLQNIIKESVKNIINEISEEEFKKQQFQRELDTYLDALKQLNAIYSQLEHNKYLYNDKRMMNDKRKFQEFVANFERKYGTKYRPKGENY